MLEQFHDVLAEGDFASTFGQLAIGHSKYSSLSHNHLHIWWVDLSHLRPWDNMTAINELTDSLVRSLKIFVKSLANYITAPAPIVDPSRGLAESITNILV